MESHKESFSAKTYVAPLLAGAVAGVVLVSSLYPLDTLKTRLQSQNGFYKSGGFKGIYRGVLTATGASVPVAAMFFGSYETIKAMALPVVPSQYAHFVHMFAASASEVLCCSLNVPVEIIKQRKQTYMGSKKRSGFRILVEAYKAEGLRRGVYRGFFSTVARDMPFSFIEFPIWEGLKSLVKERNGGDINGLQSAACAGVAGAVASAVTTPLDVAKTRIMLAESTVSSRSLHIGSVLTTIYLQSGVTGLFTGLVPRVMAVSTGAFVYLGVYDQSKMVIDNYFDR